MVWVRVVGPRCEPESPVAVVSGGWWQEDVAGKSQLSYKTALKPCVAERARHLPSLSLSWRPGGAPPPLSSLKPTPPPFFSSCPPLLGACAKKQKQKTKNDRALPRRCLRASHASCSRHQLVATVYKPAACLQCL
eukprot:355838-Chlamydomonas_euryale.AAC.2